MSRQTDIIDRLPLSGRVAVIRLRSLGDCVLSTPALRLLKQARPDLEIAVVAEDRFAGVFAGNPDAAQVLSPSVRALRGFHPSLCLNFHGGTRASRLTLLSGACFRAGFDIFKPGWIYNTPIPTAQEVMGIARRVHTAEHMASAMFYLGVPVQDVPRAYMAAPAGRSPHAPEGGYAVIHPLAALPEKTWPWFRELAQFVRGTLGLEPVFIGGAGEDLSAFAAERTVCGASLQAVAQLMRDAALFVGNDSGPAHIAAAFEAPVVVFFGPSDEEIWSPWRTDSEVLKATGAIGSISFEQARDAVVRLCARARTEATWENHA